MKVLEPGLAGGLSVMSWLLVPGLVGQDLFSLIVGLPLLLGSMLLARRESLNDLLLWPGAVATEARRKE